MPRPTVTVSERLRAYMRKKGRDTVYISSLSPSGCCADLAECVTELVDDRRAAEIEGRGCVVLEADGARILVARGMDYDDEVSLDLRNFLGAKDITVKGIRPWTL